MIFMAGGMHMVGLIGAPRRTSYTTYGDHASALSWEPYLLLLAIGALFLMVSTALLIYIVFHLMFRAPKGETAFPIADGGEKASIAPKLTERWSVWILLMIVVVLLGYVIPLMNMVQNAPPGSVPFVTW